MSASQPASEVYEIVVEEAGFDPGLMRRVRRFITGLLSSGVRRRDAGGVIITVVDRESRQEHFRHLEEMGADDDHLLGGLRRDLDSMTAIEFKARWVD